MSNKLPSDGVQHITFEGCDYCLVSPEDYDAQSLELQAVREALGKYGRHLDGCWFGYAPNAECKCGLDAALKQSRGA